MANNKKRGRPKTVDTATLIKLADRLFYEELSCSGRRLTGAELGRYCRSNGYIIGDNTITRNAELMSHIESLKQSSDDYTDNSLRPIVFTPLDARALIENNRNPRDLERAIIEIDQSYKDIADAAVINKKAAEELVMKCEKMTSELEELKAQIEKHKQDITSLKSQNKDYQTKNAALKEMIEKYIEPAIATELLKRCGEILESTSTIATKTTTEDIVTADSKITNPLLQKMLIKEENK